MKILLFLSLVFFSCQPEIKGDLIIANTNIIDLETGEISKRDVLIRDSVIALISEENTIPPYKNEVMDGSGCYLIPGLWDMHVHIQDSTYLSMFLDHGVTGVRDMGGCVQVPTGGCESLCPSLLNRWKSAIIEGKMNGPTMYIAGTQLSGTGWPTSFPVSTNAEIAHAFRRNMEDRVDFIKVYENISWESYKEIARLAHLHHLDFVGHVSEPFLLSDILELGQKSIEHIREPILYSFTKDSNELKNFMIADHYTPEDREFVKHWIDDAENVIESFKRNEAWFTPTMAVQYARQRYNDEPWLNHPLRHTFPKSVIDGLYSHIDAMKANDDKTGNALWWMALRKLVKRFSEEKIGMLAGSDTACEGGIPGYSLHEELFLMVEEAALSPLEALQTATINPCSYFGLEKKGKVDEGYYADLVLLKENPLEHIRNTLSIKAVIKNGKIVRLN
ncbi:MAG: amidohydrolase family protein [Saprospiraceae bacterium]|nr:amidohydrolase family protein [Saprospiraceae bacterium]